MQIVLSRKTLLALISGALATLGVRGRSEHGLVRAAQNRDREAFGELVKLFSKDLRRFVARRVNESDRDDVLQDTWLAVWESLPAFDGSDRFRTWLYSICYHKIQDHWRREHIRPPSAAILDAESHTAYVPREFAGVELQETLREFWEECTPDQREMLRMYYADGLTLKEISELLGRNLNTVKYQFYRVHDIAAGKLPDDAGLLLAHQVHA